MGTKRPAVQSRLSRLWKEFPSIHSRVQSCIFPLLFPALKHKPQLCKLHDPSRITHKMHPTASYQRGTLFCKWLKQQCCKIMTRGQVGKDQDMHISFWDSCAEAVLPIGLWQLSLTCEAWFCFCTLSWVPELSPLPATCPRREADLWPESPARGDGWCQSSHSDHCWKSIKKPWAYSPPSPAHAQSSFCASLNGEVLEKVCSQSQGLNKAPNRRGSY